MRVFCLIVAVTFVVCVGLMVDAWDDMCIRNSTEEVCR